MGYHTDFTGKFHFEKNASREFMEYINAFSHARHVLRNAEEIKHADPEWKKHCFHGDLGEYGEYYADPSNAFAMPNENIIQKNVPGYYCEWYMPDTGTLMHNDGTDYYQDYQNWLFFLLRNFIIPDHYILNGSVYWNGEDTEDLGILVIQNNCLYLQHWNGYTYGDPVLFQKGSD